MKWLPILFLIAVLIPFSSAYLYGTQGYGSGCYNQDCNSTDQEDTTDNNTSPPSSSSGGGGGGGFSVTPRISQAIPSELLDVTFRIVEHIVSSSDEIVTIATFQSFGRNVANVSLVYTLRDSSNRTVYSESMNIQVFSEEVVTKKFEGLNVSSGEYTVGLTVEFAGFTERFEAKCKIDPVYLSPKYNVSLLWSIFPLLLLIIVILLTRKRKSTHPL